MMISNVLILSFKKVIEIIKGGKLHATDLFIFIEKNKDI